VEAALAGKGHGAYPVEMAEPGAPQLTQTPYSQHMTRASHKIRIEHGAPPDSAKSVPRGN
jgi:hypothetical protein